MAKTKEQTSEETEDETYLSYTIEKLIIIAKDNATINIDIEKMMSGEPKNDPPRP